MMSGCKQCKSVVALHTGGFILNYWCAHGADLWDWKHPVVCARHFSALFRPWAEQSWLELFTCWAAQWPHSCAGQWNTARTWGMALSGLPCCPASFGFTFASLDALLRISDSPAFSKGSSSGFYFGMWDLIR